MAKIKYKFNLNFGGEEIRTLDDLRENFSIEDVLDNFNNGTLARWLDSRSYNNELEQVKAIQGTDAREILAEMIRIFDVSSDPAEIEADLSLFDYLERRRKFWLDIKANGLDGVDTIRALRQELETVKQKLETVKQELETVKEERDNLKQELESVNNEQNALRQRVKNVSQERDILRNSSRVKFNVPKDQVELFNRLSPESQIQLAKMMGWEALN